MSFTTPLFLFLFLPLSLILYRFIPGDRGRNLLLSALSLLFIAFGQLSGLPILLASALINWFAGRASAEGQPRRKAALCIAVAANVLLLGVFKYTAFAVENLNLFLQLGLRVPKLLLPLGVSFYTFQGLTYVIDIYRGEAEPAERFADYFLFLTFFPQFLMGPILRWKDVRLQLPHRDLSLDAAASGACRFVIGLVKSSILAGSLGSAADTVFDSVLGTAAGLIDLRLAWLGAVCYTLELYFDFSGYSDMALGLSRIFGFRFAENFNFPYVSASVREFWRRWHISLSTWFRDYVYIPLGGSRKGKLRTIRSRFVVFLLTGVWHGADWTFLFWGLMHGLLVNLEDLGVIPIRKLEKSRPGRILCRIYTLLAVTLLFVIFRADTLQSGFRLLGSLFAGGFRSGSELQLASILTPMNLVLLAVSLILAGPGGAWAAGKTAALCEGEGSSGGKVLFLCGIFLLFLLCLLFLAQGGFRPSIYMRF